MRNNKNRGFTLVELLVVIAILAILATVSVVGYTSFIERAAISNDENVATQLNKFLVALKADHTSEFYGEEIDETNIREVTAAILKDSGLNELVPQAAKHGYNFYFDLTEGKYVTMKDKEVMTSAGYKALLSFLGANALDVNSPYLGSCFTKGGDYFFVDTAGSDLADVINGLYTMSASTDYEALIAKLDGLEGVAELKTFVKNAVVATDDCNYIIEGTPKYVIFTDGIKSIVTDTREWNGTSWEVKNVDKLADITGAIKIPSTVKYIAGNALNVGSTATVVFKKTAAQLGGMAFQHFTDATIKTLDGEYKNGTCTCGNSEHAGKNVIVSVANPTVEILLNFYNPAESFGAKVEDIADKVLNHNNYAYVVYDQKTFDLNAIKFVGKNPELPSSTLNSEVEWSLLSGTHTYVKSVTRDGIVTLADTAPTTACDITFVGITPEGKTTTFILKVVAANGIAFSFDGVDMTTRDSISLFYGKSEGSNDTFTLSNIDVKYNYSKDEIKGLDLADDVTFADYETLFTANGHTLSVKTNDASGKLAIKVKVGAYYAKTVNVDLMNVNALNFVEKNTNTPYVDNDRVLYVGDDNPVLLGDLFTQKKDYPAGSQVWVVKDMPSADYSTMAGVFESTLITNAKINLADVANNTEIQFTSNGDVAIVVVVAPDAEGNYYRISEPVRVNVVNGKNVRNWKELAGVETPAIAASTTNVIMLGNVVMPESSTAASQFTISNAILYGNCFTFNIVHGVKKDYYGIIALQSSTMQDTRVIGGLYPTVSMSGGELYGTNAVWATGTSIIDNCYISNCRAPLCAGLEANVDANGKPTDVITIKNSVLFGGRYTNIDLKGGVLKVEGTVYNINQPHTDAANADSVAINNRAAGMGISVWMLAPQGTKIEGAQNFVHYTFIPETYNSVPVVKISASNITVSVDINKLFDEILTKKSGGKLKYQDYHFERSGVTYINTSIIGEDLSGLGKLATMLGVNIPTGDRTGFASVAPSGYKYDKIDVKADAGMGFLNPSATLHTYGILNTQTSLFDASQNAEFIFSPWNQTAGGVTYPVYGFTNGSILPAN